MNQKQEREVRDVTKTDYLNQVLQLMERFTESEMTGLQLEVDGLKLNLKKEVKEIVQNIASTPTVSYTHLDVYKRQVLWRWLFLMLDVLLVLLQQ